VDAVKHWHKSWVVLAGGQLCEYADDKLELAVQPINLRFATVREARTQDRRFAFEVITPSLRRIYQATSTEEAQSWLQTVANVIQSLLDG
jgi:Arf-GAP/SH3 domain/ANK repeat/PH domain-containing protein